MATLSAFLPSIALTPDHNPHLSTDLDRHAFDSFNPLVHWRLAALSAGYSPIHRVMAKAHPRPLSGIRLNNYEQDFYHRVHVSPKLVSLNNVVSLQSTPLSIWNAHFQLKTFDAIHGIEEGIDVSPETGGNLLPKNVSPLEEFTLILTVATSGPTVIDISLTFDFINTNDPVVRIIGTRVILFPFLPNWSASITESISFLTEIHSTRTGAEQRRALRKNPRRRVSFSILAEGLTRTLLDLTLESQGFGVFILPLPGESRFITAKVSSGSLFIPCDTKNSAFRQNTLAMVFKDELHAEAAEILNIQPIGITLKRPLSHSFNAGDRVFPCRQARLSTLPTLTRESDQVFSTDVDFEYLDFDNLPAAQTTTRYLNTPVLNCSSNEEEAIAFSSSRLVAVMDNQSGKKSIIDRAGKAFLSKSHHFLFYGFDEKQEFLSRLAYLNGRQKALWIPTEGDDLKIAEPSFGTTLRIKTCGYARFGVGKLGKQDIAIFLNDGSVLYRRIHEAVSQDEIEILLLNAELPLVLDENNVKKISFMQKYRLADDEIKIDHMTNELAKTTLNFIGVVD